MQEVVVSEILRSATPRRVLNVARVVGAFGWSVLRKRPRVWGVPPVLTVEPTNFCNLDCPLCTTGNGSMTRTGGRMSFETFRDIVDEIGDRLWYVLFFHQGEPYLNNTFLKSVQYASSRRIYTTTSTNAHYLDEKNAERTVESGLTSMIVSLDGTTQETYEKYRVKGDLDRVLSGIRNLVAAKKRLGSRKPYILLQFLVMRHNEHQIADVEKLASDLEVDRLLKKNIEVGSYEEAIKWMPRDVRYQRYALDGSEIKVRKGGKGICPRPFLSSLVNWDGSVVPCCFDKNGAFPMGTLDETRTISEIWNQQEYQSFREKMMHNRDEIEMCRNCSQGFGQWI